MRLPRLQETAGNRRQIISFGGINRTDNYQEGEMENCRNLSSERFPAFYPSKTDRLLWQEDGLTDVLWHKKGYLSIIDNKVSFTRYVETEKLKLCEEGWRACFTYAGQDDNKLNIKELIGETGNKEDIDLLIGEFISPDGGITEFEITGASSTESGATTITIAEIDKTGNITFSSDLLGEDKKLYRYCHGGEYLTVIEAASGVRTVAIAEPLTTKEIENLRVKKLTFVKLTSSGTEGEISEIYVTEGQNDNGITYLTFDRDIPSATYGAKIYYYETHPLDNDLTGRGEITEEPTGAVFSESAYSLYKDTYTGTLSEGEKKIVASGNYICIFPDKIYYNTETLEFGKMEEKRICAVTATNSWEFGTDYFKYTPDSFKDYGFEAGDAVSFSCQGTKNEQTISDTLKGNCITAIIRDIDYENDKLIFNSNTFVAVTPPLDVKIVIRREVPELEHLCSGGGRLYGTEGNKIHVSKYGSPQNFQFSQGGASDSYHIEVPSPGEFTGCIPYSSYILFFKEKEIIKFYGGKPSEYQIVSTAANGVQKGSERSLTEINGIIYYLGIDGVYAYSGSYPFKISKKLSDEGLTDGVGGRQGSLYILTAKTRNGEYKTYTYDTENGIWLSQERGNITKYLVFNDKNACLSGNELYILGEGEREEFFAEFCTINENAFEKKKYQRIYLRADISEGARLIVEVSFDGAPYQEIKRIFPSKRQVINVPIFPNRSDTVKIRLSGKGEVKILSLMREFIGGSGK